MFLAQEILTMTDIINEIILIGLLILGAYLAMMNIRLILLPQKTGTIIGFGESGDTTPLDEIIKKHSKGTCSCSLAEKVEGKLTFPVQVRLKDNTITKAEISPCALCMDKVKIGSRTVVQRISKLTSKLVS